MNKQVKKRNKKKLVICLTVLLLSISFLLYKLADRYLIEHVELNNTFQLTDQVSAKDNDSTSSTDTITTDDWNYNSNSISIGIKQITEGYGDNTITYYVADVELKASDSLQTAFAKNQFGANIIQNTSGIAKDNNSIFAINGDYYGFRDDGIIIRNGVIFRNNPARTGLAFYKDGTMKTYDETTTTAEALIDEGVTQTLSFGPVLVKNYRAVTDFGSTVVDTNFGNRSIQDANPRTGVGIISANHFVFIVVDGRSKGYSKGMTLTEFGNVFAALGCTDAYNLDGGGSSTMYFMDRVVNNPLGKENERGVSDILYIN